MNPDERDSSAAIVYKHSRVIEQASIILNRRGVSEVSLEEIAKRLSISRAALYYYFDDQRDLVYKCYSFTLHKINDCISSALKAHQQPDQILAAVIDNILLGSKVELAYLSDAAYLSDDQHRTILSLYIDVRDRISDIINLGIQSGQFRPCNAPLVASTVISVVTWLPLARRWRITTSLSDRDLIGTMKALLGYGIATDRVRKTESPPFEMPSMAMPIGSVFDAAARAKARHETLLAAASWLFNLKGIDATSLDEIAMRVGVTKKVIYHNLGNKRAVVTKCYLRAFRFFQNVASVAYAQPGPRIDALTASAQALAEASLREDIAPLAPNTGRDALPPEDQEELEAAALRLIDMYLATYEEGVRDGSIRALNSRAVAMLLPGLYLWLPKWVAALRSEDRATAPCEVADLYRQGLFSIRTMDQQ